MTSLSVIVAFRGSGHRDRLWRYVRSRVDRFLPEAHEVVTGTDDGTDPFHKTLALNRAVRRATGEMLLVTDADTWAPSEQIRAAMELVSPTSWARPWRMKVKLGDDDTEAVLADPYWDGEVTPPMRRRAENKNSYWPAPPHLLLRSTYWDVGGMDERFRGWGQEDEAFGLAMRAIVGQPKTVAGFAVHLWHPRIGRSGHDLWPGQERDNAELVKPYRHAVLSEGAMRSLLQRREAG